MRDLMQKAMSALNQLNQLKGGGVSADQNRRSEPSRQSAQPEDWDMSPEDALRVGTVARYK